MRFKPGVSDAMASSLHSARGANGVEKQPRSGLHHVAVPAGASVEQMLAAYRANPLVAEASAGRVATILDTPNDTNYLYQWHMHNSDGGMWADLAWNLAPNRGANVTVAVIDSGVAFEDYNTSLNGYPQTFKKATDLAGDDVRRAVGLQPERRAPERRQRPRYARSGNDRSEYEQRLRRCGRGL